MNVLYKWNKFQFASNKILQITPVVTRVHHRHFCKLQQELSKSPEISDANTDDTETSINPLSQSLEQNPTFAEIMASDSSLKNNRTQNTIAYRRKHRAPRAVSKTDRFPEIQNARSVDEIRKYLNQIKPQRRKTLKRNIMDILDSIANEGDESDKEDSVETETVDDVANWAEIREAHYRAIKQCGFLKEFEEGFKLFEEIKPTGRRLLTPRIYSAAMWLLMEQEFSLDSLNKCYQLLDEMQSKNIIPSGNVYAELIRNSTGLREHKRASALIKTVLDDEIYLNSRLCMFAILNHYSKTRQIVKALQFMSTLSDKLGTNALDDIMYSTVLSGMSAVVKSDKSIIDAAEKLFEQSFTVLGRAPNHSVFSSFLACYAAVPDTASCIDVVRKMISNEDWPNPSAYSFSACLKSLTQHYNDPLSYEEGWNYVNEILEMMGEDWKSDQNHEASYGLLFTLCGGSFVGYGDLEKLYMFYDDLVNNGLKLSPSGANSLLMSGIDCYKFKLLNEPHNAEEIKQDLMKYINWGIAQYKAHKLSLSRHQNEKLEAKLRDIM